MMIEFQCGNFSDFDAALGRYVECGEKIIVSGDQVGQFVTCTKCNQQVEVPYAPATDRPATQKKSPSKKPAATPSKKPAATKPPKRPDQRSPKAAAKRNRPAGAAKTSKNQPTSTRRANPKSAAGAGNARRQSNRIQKTDVMSMEFDNSHATSTLAEDRKERCRKCGSLVKSGQCTACHHVEPKFEKLHQPLDQIQIEVAGCQRWFCRTMSEGASLKFLEYGSHILFGLFGVLMMAAAILSLFGLGLGPIGGCILLVVLGLAVFFYVGLMYKGHQFLRDPNARLAWFQKPFWNLMLVISRAMNWQNYDGRLKGRKIITIRDPNFGDGDIADLGGIKTCQVLDLQGTKVTDQGLLELYGLKHLCCVVLKKTNVTHQGVFRLQQSFPRLWIWS